MRYYLPDVMLSRQLLIFCVNSIFTIYWLLFFCCESCDILHNCYIKIYIKVHKINTNSIYFYKCFIFYRNIWNKERNHCLLKSGSQVWCSIIPFVSFYLHYLVYPLWKINSLVFLVLCKVLYFHIYIDKMMDYT